MNDKIEQSLYAFKMKKKVCRTSQDRHLERLTYHRDKGRLN